MNTVHKYTHAIIHVCVCVCVCVCDCSTLFDLFFLDERVTRILLRTCYCARTTLQLKCAVMCVKLANSSVEEETRREHGGKAERDHPDTQASAAAWPRAAAAAHSRRAAVVEKRWRMLQDCASHEKAFGRTEKA